MKHIFFSMEIVSQRKKNIEIICFSTQPWYGSYWTNKQQIMSRLAKMGHKILYINPYDYASWGHLFRSLKRKISRKQLIIPLDQPQENLWLYSPIDLLPVLRNGIFLWLNQKLRELMLKLQLKRYDFKKPLLWIYQPESVDFVDHLAHGLVVYDCVDEYSAFPYYSNNPKRKKMILKKEDELLKKADIVFTTSKTLYERKKQKNKNTFLVGNVGDFEHFNVTQRSNYPIAPEMRDVPHPILGFVGALDSYKVDFEIIKNIATAHPEWSIVLIGKTEAKGEKTDISKIKKLGNIHFLGGKPYEITPQYIKAFDVCIIPYNINDYTKSCFPLKFHEFLATGKPLVVTALPDLIDFGDISYLSYTPEEFLQNCEKAVKENNLELSQKRQKIASQNTWEDRVNKLLEIINSYKKDAL